MKRDAYQFVDSDIAWFYDSIVIRTAPQLACIGHPGGWWTPVQEARRISADLKTLLLRRANRSSFQNTAYITTVLADSAAGSRSFAPILVIWDQMVEAVNSSGGPQERASDENRGWCLPLPQGCMSIVRHTRCARVPQTPEVACRSAVVSRTSDARAYHEQNHPTFFSLAN